MNILKYGPIILLMASSSLLAQTPEQESAQMQQKALQQMAAMQNCMMQIDLQEMASMEKRSSTMETELRSLCAQGNESAAKQRALAFSEEVMNSKTMQAMKKCAAMMPGMEQQMEVPDFKQELEKQSICDIINQQL